MDSTVGIISLVVGVIGILIGIAGIIIALYQYNDRRKLEQFSKTVLRGMAGNIAKIQQSTSWCKTNLMDANNTAIKLPDSELKEPLLKFIANGIGDATATDRLTINLFNEALTMQEAQFDTREIIHPEREDLDLFKRVKAQLDKSK